MTYPKPASRHEKGLDDSDVLGDLLPYAPADLDVPLERMVRAESRLRAQWEHDIRRPAVRRRRFRSWASAALAAAVVLAVGGVLWRASSSDVLTAPAKVPSGEARVVFGSVRMGDRLVATGELVDGTDPFRTADAHAVLELAGGGQLRLDAGTRVRFSGERRLGLDRGAVYFDSADATDGFEVRTDMGAVRDVGTRFEVRRQADLLQVRVRDGFVTVNHAGGTEEASTGVEIELQTDGTVHRRLIARDGPEWRWVLAASPPFELGGRRVEEFLEWVAFETGWEVRYADDEVARAAARIRLQSGSTRGIPPDKAPEVVLPTCGLTHRLERATSVASQGAPHHDRRRPAMTS